MERISCGSWILPLGVGAGSGLCHQGGGARKSLEVLKIEVKVIFSVFLTMFLLKLSLKLIANGDKLRKISVLSIIIGPRPLGGARRVHPTPWIR